MKNVRKLLKICVMVLLIIGLACVVPTASKDITALSDEQGNAIANKNKLLYASYVNEVYELINAERTAAGVSAVNFDDTLTLMAMHRAAENAYMDWWKMDSTHHIRPNGKEASSICYYYKQYGSFGENLGRYQASSAEIVQGWHDSPAHYQCMISQNYKRVGIGVAQDSEGYYYWAAIFMN